MIDEMRNGPPAVTPEARFKQPGSHHATDLNASVTDTAASAEDRRRRVREFRACAATWAHLASRGLTSETVRDTLQEILRSAA